MKQLPETINDAIQLFKDGKTEQSRTLLKDYICSIENGYEALLWLAKVSPNQAEALTAAELAYHLDPKNEVAQRAVVAVRSRGGQQAEWDPQLDVISFTGMTVAQARAVNWPFRGYKRPIGVLLDEKCIEMRDLGWAAQSSFDPYIKTAARTLLLNYLLDDKTETLPRSVKVARGRDYSGYLERISNFQAGIYLGVLIGICMLLIGLFLMNLIFHLFSGSTLNLISLAFVPFIVAIFAITGYEMKKADNAKAGKEGESNFLDQLQAVLQGTWYIYQNISWPTRRWGDVDLILVGKGGIWVFEVKAYSSLIRNRGDIWEYKSRWGWRKMSKDPGKQATRNAARIREYLQTHGVNPGWVQPVVIWAGNPALLATDDPTVPVWKVSEIQDQIVEVWRQQKLSNDQIDKVDEIFQKLISGSRVTTSA